MSTSTSIRIDQTLYDQARSEAVKSRLISTHCIETGRPLLYSDRGFDSFVKRLELRSALSEN